jgi:Flp pilus assembly protein TadG
MVAQSRKMMMSAVFRSLLHLRRDQRGIAAVTVAIALPLLLAFGALAINSGLWFTIKRENQSAADAAALSAAYELMAGPADACKTDPNFVADRLTPAVTQAVAANQHMGWDNTVTNTIVTCPYPPDLLLDTEFPKGYQAVAVTLQQTQSSLFAFAPTPSATIATKSVGVVANAQDVCFLALGQSPARSGPCPAGFGICGNGSVDITTPDCAVVADSTADNSIDLVGNSASITAGAIVTAGGVAGSGGISGTHPTAQTYATPIPDPYAPNALGTCANPPCLTHTFLTSSMPTLATSLPCTPSGTTYSGPCVIDGRTTFRSGNFTLSGPMQFSDGLTVGGTVDLSPGTYWITDGDLNVSGTLKCTGCTGGAGVTIILTTARNSCPGPPVPTVGTVNFANGNTSLNAPTTGTFKGDLIVEDVNGVPACTKYTGTSTNLRGAPNATFSGLVYLPNVAMDTFGNASVGGCFVLVVGYLRMSGNPSLDTTGCAAAGVTPPTIKTVVLGE